MAQVLAQHKTCKVEKFPYMIFQPLTPFPIKYTIFSCFYHTMKRAFLQLIAIPENTFYIQIAKAIEFSIPLAICIDVSYFSSFKILSTSLFNSGKSSCIVPHAD